MHELGAGKQGMPTQGAGPVRIYRPGDPGFQEATMSADRIQDGYLTPCQHPGCAAKFLPKRKDSRYCPEHNTSQARSARQRIESTRKAPKTKKPRPPSRPKRARTAGRTPPATARRPAKRREEGSQPRGQGTPGLLFSFGMVLNTASLVQLLRAAADRLEEEGV